MALGGIRHLEEEEGGREQRAHEELEHRILREHHQANEDEVPQHLDELSDGRQSSR